MDVITGGSVTVLAAPAIAAAGRDYRSKRRSLLHRTAPTRATTLTAKAGTAPAGGRALW